MPTSLRIRAAVAVAASCMLTLVACDGGEGPSISPTPSPSTQSSPGETALERQKRLDFEEAEKNYRAFIAEYNRVAKAGGADAATPAMKANAAGPFLDFYVSELRTIRAQGTRYTSGVEVGYVHPGAYSPQQLTLDVCEDGSKNKVLDRHGKQISSGSIGLRSIYARPVGGRWMMWDGDERGDVKSCQS